MLQRFFNPPPRIQAINQRRNALIDGYGVEKNPLVPSIEGTVFSLTLTGVPSTIYLADYSPLEFKISENLELRKFAPYDEISGADYSVKSAQLSWNAGNTNRTLTYRRWKWNTDPSYK